MKAHTLLVACLDRTGLVAKITGALFRRGFNITSNGEFVDHESGLFFMRTEFEGAGRPAPGRDKAS